MPRPSLAFYEPSKGPSGPARYIDAILRSLDLDEFEVTLFGHEDGPHRHRDGLRFVATDAGSATAIMPASPRKHEGTNPSRKPRLATKSLRFLAGTSRECLSLARVFRKFPIGLLHTQNTGCEESPIAARLAGIPRVLGTFHVDSTYDLLCARNGLSYRFLECLSNRCLHRAIAVSQATGEDWVRRTKISRSRVTMIPNGVDGQSFRRRGGLAHARQKLGLPVEGRVYVGGVGRLDSAKGFETLIESTALICDEFPNLSVVIAGDGPLRGQLQAKALDLDIVDRVHFVGFRSDVRQVYEALDIFALPSLCEAMPYALLEAMAMNLPAVGSTVGGVPEVIEHGTTGFLVRPSDPRALAASLRILLASETLRTRMGEAGRSRVLEHFGQADTVRKTIEVYREMFKRMV